MVVWVTGASSGLGLHTALELKKAGMTVVCGARSFGGNEGEGEGGYRLYLDVKDVSSIDAFCERAFAFAGAPDALCCCAGVLTLGPCEEYTLDELRDVMETNFFGQAAVIHRVMPMMRARGQGKILLFSSVNGRLGVPFQGAYTASKHAVEGFAECLRMEAAPYGVSVCVVEPGDHQSGAQTYRRRAGAMRGESVYHEAFERAVAQIAHDEKTGSDPDLLGKKLAKALQKKRLPCRLLIAKPDQKLAVFLHETLPVRLFSRIIASYYGKPI